VDESGLVGYFVHSHIETRYSTRRTQNTHNTCDYYEINMPAPANTLLIEGSFEELSDELAQHIDTLRKTQNVEGAPIQPEVSSLLQEKRTEDALKKLVGAASILNAAPEKG
jgi:hypothetical protein